VNVLITGASRGIGRALALAFGADGHRVLVNYRSRRAEAESTVEALRRAGAETESFQADVADPAQARALVARAVERWGTLDGLINNAGISRDRTILKMSEAEWRQVLDVNLNGAFWCLKAAAEHMTRRRDGFIINIASIIGVRGGVGCANYAASKAGLVGLTKSAAREFGRFNIRVNAVLPGFHATEMNVSLPEEYVARLKAEHVLGRTPDMDEMARFVLTLAKQTSVSGQIIPFESRIL
jgi:3-oxoacyl-[acyl-carrier protein] reductase